jgi:ABC-2 type transport system ATP-binding protein
MGYHALSIILWRENMKIELNEITKKYKNQTVFSNLNFSFESNRIYGVVGPNGIGKSTLFKCIVGLTDVDNGKIIIDKNEITPLKRVKVVENISYLLSTGVIKHLSGWENTILFAKLFDINNDELVKLFHEFDLYTAKDKKVSNYSLGMKQRLALIIAFINIKRKIIILDEPYLGLDPIGIKTLNEKLLKLKDEDYLIIVSNHQLHESEKIFDEVIFLTDSGIIVKGSNDTSGDSLAETFEKIYVTGGGE